MTSNEIKKLMKAWNKLETKVKEIRIIISDLERERQQESYNCIQDDMLKDAVLEALKLIFKRGEKLELREGTGAGAWIYAWVSASQIRDCLVGDKLYPTDKIKTIAICSEIGLVLASMGFTQSKRASSGNLRLIEKDKLYELLAEPLTYEGDNPAGLTETVTFKGLPPQE